MLVDAKTLALFGGTPVRAAFLPYSRQTVSAADRSAVLRVLDSDFLTTGPEVVSFEEKLQRVTGGAYAAAVSNGTAALHCMLDAYSIAPGDEVIVPVITFAATANAVRYMGATPVFADVESDTLLIDPAKVEHLVNPSTKAIIAVDFAGQPADYSGLRSVLPDRVYLLADAAHSIGASLDMKPVGTLADASTFSFHPVKPVAAGEGGAVVSIDNDVIKSVKTFRNHGIDNDHEARKSANTWTYSISRLGFNYRLSDIHCALASSQLDSMESRRLRRQELSEMYDSLLSELTGVSPLVLRHGIVSSHHLYVVKLDLKMFTEGRDMFFSALRAENIGVNVHYQPIPAHPYYQNSGDSLTDCPVGADAYEIILSLPLWSGMTNTDLEDVVTALKKVTAAFKR